MTWQAPASKALSRALQATEEEESNIYFSLCGCAEDGSNLVVLAEYSSLAKEAHWRNSKSATCGSLRLAMPFCARATEAIQYERAMRLLSQHDVVQQEENLVIQSTRESYVDQVAVGVRGAPLYGSGAGIAVVAAVALA